MWRRAEVRIGDQTAEQAMVDFGGRPALLPEFLEWPTRLVAGTEIMIGDETRIAGASYACAQQFHVKLLVPPQREAAPEPAESPESVKTSRRKGSNP
jgi:hypothetical protein